MKKIILIVVGIICLSLVGYLFYDYSTTSIITLEINPSIEIYVNHNERIKKVKALNEDAKEIISDDLKGKSLSEGLSNITVKLEEKGYIIDKFIDLLLYTSGSMDNNTVKEYLERNFEEKHINFNIIVIDNISSKDKSLAEKNNISVAKAAYINHIIETRNNIDTSNLVDKSINDLEETKNTGKYCEAGYILEGDSCLKEIRRVAASQGLVCPDRYFEYQGTCYESEGIIDTDEIICPNEFTLRNNRCERTISIDAQVKDITCGNGIKKTKAEAGIANQENSDANEYVCIDLSNATHPVSPCEANDGTEYTVVGGKCYWHRAPVIAEGCPGKVQVAGECWDDATGIYICPGYRDGKRYSSKDEYCENSIKIVPPTSTEYKCESGYTLKGASCEKIEETQIMYKRTCPQGYELINNEGCINTKKTANKTQGFICSMENSKVENNECVIYEIVEAKK